MKWAAAIVALSCPAILFAQTAPHRITFTPGAISHEWRGAIQAGQKDFVLRLGKEQTLMVDSGQVYTWSIITPEKKELGCGTPAEGGHCPPGGSIASLPVSGDYIVRTTYRMSDCATCPVSKSRNVNVVFIAR